MRKNVRGIMIWMLFCLVFITGFIVPSHVVFAAMCSGDNCTGLFADSTCTAYSGLTPFTYNNAYIEPRSSNVCNAQWTRVHK